MRLERHKEVPDLKAHWKNLFDITEGEVQGRIGYLDEHQRDRFDLMVKWVSKYAPMKQGIEVGCCEGIMTEKLAPSFEHLLAVDFLPEFFELCPKLPNVTYEEHNLDDWQDPPKADMTILGEVLEHVVDPVGVLKRFGAKSTWILASCPVDEPLGDHTWHQLKLDVPLKEQALGVGEGAGHVWAMDMEGFESMFEKAGLKVEGTWSDHISGIVLAHGN